MSSQAIGVVATPVKDVFLIMRLISTGIQQLLNYCKAQDPENQHLYGAGTSVLDPHGRLVDLTLTYAGKPRTLTVYFDADGDHEDIAPQTLSLGMGVADGSEALIRSAMAGLSVLGPVYFTPDDSASDPEMKAPRMPFTTSLIGGLTLPVDYDRFLDDFLDSRGIFPLEGTRGMPLRALFGLHASELIRLRETENYRTRWYEMEQLVKRAVAGTADELPKEPVIPAYWPQLVSA